MHYLLLPYSIAILLFVWFYDKKNNQAALAGMIFMCMVTIVMLWSAIVFRPLSGDSWRYMQKFKEIQQLTFVQAFGADEPEFLFRWLNWFIGQLTSSKVIFFSSIFVLFIVPFWIACRRYFSLVNSIALLMACSMYPYFIAYAASGIRQGMGLSLMLLALVMLSKRSKWGWLWLFLAPLWHGGMGLAVLVIIGIYLIPRFFDAQKFIFIMLGVSILLSFTGVNDTIASYLPTLIDIETRHDIYFNKEIEINYRTGFRADFFIFSMFPLVIYYFLKKEIVNNVQPEFWITIYAGLNSIYHFFSFAPFADRFASFSWFIIPFVLLVIIVNSRNIGFYIKLFVLVFSMINILLLQFYSGKYLT